MSDVFIGINNRTARKCYRSDMVIKKIGNWLFLLLVLCAGSVSAELKIAVVDPQRAMLESDEAKGLLTQASEDLKDEQDEVTELRDDIVALQEKLQKDGEVMSQAEQRKVQKEIESKQLDFEFGYKKLQKEPQDRQQAIFQQIGPKYQKVIQDLIEIEGYDLIMDRNSLIYANSKHEITRKITEKLNENRQ